MTREKERGERGKRDGRKRERERERIERKKTERERTHISGIPAEFLLKILSFSKMASKQTSLILLFENLLIKISVFLILSWKYFFR